jgi:hypothetical protein
MPAIFDRVLTVNLVANTAIFYVAARLYLLPLVPRVRPQVILVPILLLHSMRHLGLMFLTRGATFPGMPLQFAYPAAFGDLITAILAFAAIPIRVARQYSRQVGGVDFQYFRNPRSACSDHLRHDLQCASRNGTSLLDSGFLGSAVVGDTLRDFCASSSSLVGLSRREPSHESTRPEGRPSPRLRRVPHRCIPIEPGRSRLASNWTKLSMR